MKKLLVVLIAAKYAQIEDGRSGFYWFLHSCVPSMPVIPLALPWANFVVSLEVSSGSVQEGALAVHCVLGLTHFAFCKS